MASYQNPLINAMLTDLYELTMLDAYFKDNQHRQTVAFEYFYRHAPFGASMPFMWDCTPSSTICLTFASRKNRSPT